MINVSTAFKNTALSLVKSPCAKLVCTDGVNTVTLDSHTIQSFELERSACVSSTFTLGSTVATTFKATVLTSALSSFTSLDQLQVTAHMGFVINGVETYIQEGIYYLDDSQTTNKGLFTDVTGYDLFMSKSFDQTIEPSFIENFGTSMSPSAAFAALEEVYTGLSFDYSAVPSDPADNIPVLIDDTMSLRTVLSRLAIASGCNLMISPMGVITCVYPTFVTELNLTPSNFKTCDIDGRDKTYVAYLTCEVEGEEESETAQYPALIPGDDCVGLEFDNTYFSTDAALQTIYERFIPLTVNPDAGYRCLAYQGHTLDTGGFPFMEPLDQLTVTRRKPNGTTETFTLLPLTVKHSYNGALKTTFSATTIQQTQSVSSSTSAQTAATTKSIVNRISTLRNQVVAIYGACGTSELITEKAVDVSGFNLFNGVTITVKFQYENTVDNPTMNVNSTGAFPIYANNAPLTYPSPYSWKAGQIVTFVFANDTWMIANANPANFCGFVDDGNGGRVLQISSDADANSFHTDIGSSQIALKYGGTTQLAIDSNSIVIGANATQQMVLNSQGLSLTNNDASLVMTTQTDGNGDVHSTVILSSGASASETTLSDSQLSTATVEHQQAKFTNASSAASTANYILEKRKNGHLSIKVY